MSVLTTSTTFYPRSFQLKLALSGRRPPLIFLRARFPVFGRRGLNLGPLVLRSSAVNESRVEQRSSGNSSRSNLNSSADDLSGWANTDDERQTDDSKPKQSLAGILAAGAAGIVLVAGLTFAALSMSKRSTSVKVKEQMEPMTEEQENLLSSKNNQSQIVEEETGDKVGILKNSGGESEAGLNNDTSLHKQDSDSIESRITDDVVVSQSAEDVNDSFRAGQRDSSVSDSLVSPEAAQETPISDMTVGSFALPIGIVDSGNPSEPVAEKISGASTSKTSTFDGKSKTLAADLPMANLGAEEKYNLSAKDSPVEQSILKIPVESVTSEVIDSRITQKEFVDSGKGLSVKFVEQSTELSKSDVGFARNAMTFVDADDKSLDGKISNGTTITGSPLVPEVDYQSINGAVENDYNQTIFDSVTPEYFFTSAGIPAPSSVPAALLSPPGKVLVPAVTDQLQSQALSALQILKVIEEDVQPGDLCTRREYARWLVLASSFLSRNATSKVYPAMYIENSSELAFDDITPEDPDFPCIQGLAEAGLIASKLSRRDMQPFGDEDTSLVYFSPESPLSRQDLVSWKMALEKRQLPVVDKKALQQSTGFIDLDKINPDAWPSLVADLAAGEQSIITLAFGYTRLFQPDKPVTKAQAAIALSTGEASTIVSEELARIEAEAMAEKAVAAHSALVAQVEENLNANYEQELSLEREKINAIEKMAEEARSEVEKLRAAREEEKLSLMKERAAVDSEMELLSRLRQEVEEKLQTLMADKLEISYEKERLNKLRIDAETESQEITRLQYELEVERKALSMARAWAEEEAKRAREQAKALDEARERWEVQGLKIVVDKDLREEAEGSDTWLEAGKQFSVEETIERSETLVEKLRRMADKVSGKCKDTINKIIEKITLLISDLKKKSAELTDATKSQLNTSFQGVQQSLAGFTSTVKDGTKRIAGDWKEGVERLSQRFKT